MNKFWATKAVFKRISICFLNNSAAPSFLPCPRGHANFDKHTVSGVYDVNQDRLL